MQLSRHRKRARSVVMIFAVFTTLAYGCQWFLAHPEIEAEAIQCGEEAAVDLHKYYEAKQSPRGPVYGKEAS